MGYSNFKTESLLFWNYCPTSNVADSSENIANSLLFHKFTYGNYHEISNCEPKWTDPHKVITHCDTRPQTLSLFRSSIICFCRDEPQLVWKPNPLTQYAIWYASFNCLFFSILENSKKNENNNNNNIDHLFIWHLFLFTFEHFFEGRFCGKMVTSVSKR